MGSAEPLVKLTETHLICARLLGSGVTPGRVKKDMGINEPMFCRLMATKEFQDEIALHRRQRAEAIIASEQADPERTRLKKLVPKIAKRMGNVIDSGDNVEAIKAADVVLKHALPNSDDRGGKAAAVVQVMLSEEKAKDLEAMAVEKGS